MSAAYTAIRHLTPEELYGPEFERLKRAELWDGELVEMSPSSWHHSDVAGEIFHFFRRHLGRGSTFRAGYDNVGFLLRGEPPLLLCPDVSVFRPGGPSPWISGAPVVAVEVLSPSNSRTEMTKKRQWYLEFGSEQVWIVDPRMRTIEVSFADGRVLVATGGELACEGALEGLRIPLAELFEDQPPAEG